MSFFELLNSLSHQTCKDFEVIIVDDGSKIELQPTVDMFQEMLNIRYFKKENTGPGLSCNYGAYRAEGVAGIPRFGCYCRNGLYRTGL
jgi:glycosyltransferase involved in cell wall biosynthesis